MEITNVDTLREYIKKARTVYVFSPAMGCENWFRIPKTEAFHMLTKLSREDANIHLLGRAATYDAECGILSI